jgi:uncharacterized protein (DUF1499 family)
MRRRVVAACLVGFMAILCCSGKRPSNLGVSDAGLADCPASPNCVSSDASDAAHRVEAFALFASPEAAWRAVREEVAGLPRTTVVEQTATYLHAECASAFFGFVDDLELQLRSSERVVAVRSASRIGRSDLGVNRRRVERLREALRARGVLR